MTAFVYQHRSTKLFKIKKLHHQISKELKL
jgi:hypothetical protein